MRNYSASGQLGAWDKVSGSTVVRWSCYQVIFVWNKLNLWLPDMASHIMSVRHKIVCCDQSQLFHTCRKIRDKRIHGWSPLTPTILFPAPTTVRDGQTVTLTVILFNSTSSALNPNVTIRIDGPKQLRAILPYQGPSQCKLPINRVL